MPCDGKSPYEVIDFRIRINIPFDRTNLTIYHEISLLVIKKLLNYLVNILQALVIKSSNDSVIRYLIIVDTDTRSIENVLHERIISLQRSCCDSANLSGFSYFSLEIFMW